MSLKLRDLIRQVRACKTAAEERAVIAKESAMIRTAIREEQAHYRHRNVAKLLFMHMLGYPTHFGQLECMKLIASPHFPEKRIGYLGMMLLLSEEADVLMLATNALKNDLNSDNHFVAGLALCAIGNLATADMSRDLAPEVDKHLKSSQPYLRKKACLAMARCLTKCPEMVEDFVDRVITLLKDRSHGVLITVVQLMTQVLIMDQKNREEETGTKHHGSAEDEMTPCQAAFTRLVPALVKLLRNVISAGYSPDYDVSGGPDPFLQVQVLTLLRLLGTGNEKASEEMNDVLAQVATNTDSAKNAGNAILYECVQTIMAIESEDSLRVLAVNILGRFLLNRDNNIRYVALNTLSKCIAEEKRVNSEDLTHDASGSSNNASSALQRHRSTVVDCLKDPDISIRQRALELIYHLVNGENVESITAELLNYLVLCPREHRGDICNRILRVVEKYSPNDRFRVDTLITMLTIAGRESARNVQSASIIYISRSSDDLHAYATHKLLKAIRDDDGSQRGLLVVAIWCIGEYGDLLLKPYAYTPPSSNDISSVTAAAPSTEYFSANDAASVVNTVEEVTKRHTCPDDVKQRALTCYAKLSDRFANTGDVQTLNKLQSLIKKHSKSQLLELQLRSCEYDALVNALKGVVPTKSTSANNDIFGMDLNSDEGVNKKVQAAAKEALARMPVVDLSVLQRKRATDVDFDGDNDTMIAVKQPPQKQVGGDLLDLNDIFGSAPESSVSNVAMENGQTNTSTSTSQETKSDIDLLSDIFSASTMPSMPPTQIPSSNPIDIFGSQPAATPISVATPSPAPAINDIFASSPAPPASNGNVQGPLIVHGFSHGGLTVEFECTKPEVWNKQNSTLVAKFINQTDAPIYGLNLQCAVPKYVKMEMKPPTSTTIPVTAGNAKQVTQTISVSNSMLGTKNLMLKLKIGFTSKGTKIDHMATCSGFPQGEY